MELGAHPGLAAQAAEDGGVDRSDRTIHVRVVHRRDRVPRGARNQVLLICIE